jgi:hypothetical protein
MNTMTTRGGHRTQKGFGKDEYIFLRHYPDSSLKQQHFALVSIRSKLCYDSLCQTQYSSTAVLLSNSRHMQTLVRTPYIVYVYRHTHTHYVRKTTKRAVYTLREREEEEDEYDEDDFGCQTQYSSVASVALKFEICKL